MCLQEWEPLAEVQLDPQAGDDWIATVPDPAAAVVMNWRGDGKYLATSHVVSKDG